MQEKHIVKILSVGQVTHDVKSFKLEKPSGYSFIPGQATELTINKEGWLDKRNPFTFTSLNEWDHLEFTIKIYKERNGVTNQLSLLKPGDELILHDVWGAIQYKGEGSFIAGGAGVLPVGQGSLPLSPFFVNYTKKEKQEITNYFFQTRQ